MQEIKPCPCCGSSNGLYVLQDEKYGGMERLLRHVQDVVSEREPLRYARRGHISMEPPRGADVPHRVDGHGRESPIQNRRLDSRRVV